MDGTNNNNEDGATTHARVKMEEEDQSDVEMIIDHSDYAPLSGNELYDKWKANRKVLPEAFHRLLDPDLGDEQLRGDLFSAEDEQAMEQYAWAIPDDRALAICQAFAPIVEMGAGAGYWARLLRERNVCIHAFDKRTKHVKAAGVPIPKPFTKIQTADPEILAAYPNATLLLIYPDDHEEEDDDHENQFTLSVASLQHYSGDVIIHVGEWLGSTWTMTMEGQGTCDTPYPWGRSTSPDFQMLLEASFHKILQYELPNWGSVRNCLTVWKRTTSVVLEGDRYAFVPEEEKLNLNMASPSTRHLLE